MAKIECVCKSCGRTFLEIPSRIKNGRGKYCSKSCQFSTDRETLFWKHVDKCGPVHPILRTNCWIWTGSRDGLLLYGNFYDKDKLVRAHRYSWELKNGAIPDGLKCLHDCDNPSCVRPDHLHLGTQSDNIHEMWKRGRKNVDGARNPAAKLDESIVESIRSLYGYRGKNGLTLNALSDRFGVSISSIERVIKNQTWKRGDAQ